MQDGVVTDVIGIRGVPFTDFVVPENCVFAMGDNRPHSTDCRSFGCIPLEKIESTVAIRIWPLDKCGKVEEKKLKNSEHIKRRIDNIDVSKYPRK